MSGSGRSGFAPEGFDLAAAVRVRRVTPGKPRAASLGDRAEIDDGTAGANAAAAQYRPL